MKNASEIMYKIGKIINIIMIPLSVLFLIIGIAVIASTQVSDTMPSAEADKIAAASTLIGYGIVFLITSILSIIICPMKHKEIENGSKEVAPRVFIIVFGAIAENIFYVLAGIFSLVARSQELNSTPSDTITESSTDSDTNTNE